jgi:hypothetical protein
LIDKMLCSLHLQPQLLDILPRILPRCVQITLALLEILPRCVHITLALLTLDLLYFGNVVIGNVLSELFLFGNVLSSHGSILPRCRAACRAACAACRAACRDVFHPPTFEPNAPRFSVRHSTERDTTP